MLRRDRGPVWEDGEVKMVEVAAYHWNAAETAHSICFIIIIVAHLSFLWPLWGGVWSYPVKSRLTANCSGHFLYSVGSGIQT